MENWLYWKTLALMLILGCFLGCGGDGVGDEGSVADPAPETDAEIPTITIEKVRTETLEDGREKVWWRLNADSAPHTDLAVWMKGKVDWVIIPKSQNNSETFSRTFSWNGEIAIEPLPIVSIVGKGVVADLQVLQRHLPSDTLGGHRIPEDFDFPLYKIGESSHIVVDVAHEPRPAAFFVSANPPHNSRIEINSTITLTFDNPPADVTTSAGTLRVVGRTVKISGPFPSGHLILTITWADGSQALRYDVIAPDITPPQILGGSFRDGDIGVDSEAINADGKIEFTFSEDIVGNITLQTERGDDVGWIGKVEGDRVILELVKGKEIRKETTYVVRGKVSDAAGNETEVSITFVTNVKRVN